MWRRSVKVAYRTLLYTIASALVLFAVLLTVLRYLLPQLPDLTTDVEQFFADNYAVEMTINQLGADWNTAGPQLILRDISIHQLGGEAADLKLNEARVIFNFWQSVRTLSVKFEQVTLADLHVTYDLRDASIASNVGMSEQIPRFFLNQLDEVTIENSRLEIINLVGVRRAVLVDRLSWQNQGLAHQGIGSFRIDGLASNALDVMIDIKGNDPRDLAGQIYVQASNLDIAGWLQQQVVDAKVSQAEFNFTLWLNFAASEFRNGTLQLARNELHWQVGQQRHQLVIPKGLMRLRPQQDGWLVNNNPLTFIKDSTTWTLPTMSWLQTPERTVVSANQVPLAPLVQLASLAGSTGQAWAEKLTQSELQGALDVRLQRDLQQPLQWQVQGQDLAWQGNETIPGVAQVDVNVVGQGQYAQWQLQGEQVAVNSRWLDSAAPWQIANLNVVGDFSWRPVGQPEHTWRVRIADGSRIELQGLPLALRATLQQAEQLEIAARVTADTSTTIDAEVLRRYLPEVMGAELHDYLQTALLEAEAESITMLWRGALEEFPYKQQQGVFRAQASLRNLVYKFQPNWPSVADASAYVHFGNERMHIRAENGQLLDMGLPQVDTILPDLTARPPQLLISGDIAGDGTALQPIFAQSPLATSLGSTFEELQLSGPLTGRLQLTVPLDNSRQVLAEGYGELANNTLLVESLGQRFDQLTGRIRFRNDEISSANLRVAWQQLPVALTLQGQQREQDYHVELQAQAEWSMAELAERIPSTASLFTGEFHWDGQLALSLPQDGGYSFHWQQQSDLLELGMLLPAPLDIPQGAGRAWQLQVSGSPESLLINSSLGEQSLLELQFNGDASELQQGYARIGNTARGAPNPDLLGLQPKFPLEIGLPEIDGLAWGEKLVALNQWLSDWLPEPQSAHRIASPVPDLIEIRADTVTLGDHTLDDNAIVLWPQEEPQAEQVIDTWQWRWRAEQTALTGSYWPARAEQRAQVRIAADFLELARPEVIATVEETTEVEQDPAKVAAWPSLQFECRRCQYGDYDLGEIALQVQPQAQGLRFTEIQITQGEHRLLANMDWQFATGAQTETTRFYGSLDSDDLGQLLNEYDITSIIQDSPAEFNYDLRWRGAPGGFNVASLNGTMEWELGQGYLNDVSDGGARIFSVLSLESILRKLRFDFRDIFANGMFFTEFSGAFDIADGVVSTDNAVMDGSAGDMQIIGQSNLVTEAIDYRLYFVPKVTSSLPVILAWMVNPPSGLAALLIDQMLQDAQVISRLEYKITGTIDAPVVEEVSRASREVTIPVDELPSEAQQQEKQNDNGNNASEQGATNSSTDDQPTAAAGQLSSY